MMKSFVPHTFFIPFNEFILEAKQWYLTGRICGTRLLNGFKKHALIYINSPQVY